MTADDAGCEAAVLGGAARFDHVAHAAPRIRDLLPMYTQLLGGELCSGGDNPRVGYRAVQLAFPGGRKLELMEPTAGSAFFDRFFARHPAGGLHHVTFRVDDVRHVVARARAAGYAVVGEHYEDERWQEAFLHPRAAHGVLVQVVQAWPDYPPPLSAAAFDALLGPI